MLSKAVRFGLIGLGEINEAHRRGYRDAGDRVEVAAVCDVNGDVAQRQADVFKCRAYTSYEDLLDDPSVDAVDITLPHHLHYPVAHLALERGKHVLVEKPMAGTSAECLELIRLGREKGVQFTVAENTRFVKAYLAARALLEEGALGEVRLIRTFISGTEVQRLRDKSLWKGQRWGTLGGAIFDAGPHSFYLLKWLLGDVTEVQARQARLVSESDVEDNGLVSGRLAAGGIFSTEFTFTAEIPWGERCEIYGAHGSIIIDQLCNPPAVHYRGPHDFSPVGLVDVPYWPREWKYNSVADGVRDFIDAIREDRPTAVDPVDGYYAVKIVERAYASAANDGVVVKV